jgi:hypothetical protein
VERQGVGYPVQFSSEQPNLGRLQLHIQRVISRILLRGKTGLSPHPTEEDASRWCYGISHPSESEDEEASSSGCRPPESEQTQAVLKSMDVECPACGAKVREPCNTLSGKAMPESHSHSRRNRVALARQYTDLDVKQVDARVVRKATEGK